jgi:carbamoylphosphate synthase large subunit
MNLLVTNTRNAQAYAIIRALRPYANKIVATMEGDHRLPAWFSHAARSRLVDTRYFTPSPAADWRAGKIQMENTEKEEVYIQAILEICKRENIDTIFPSYDAHVYVFSKNKARFKKIGVLITVPDYEAVITPLDKYRTVQAAEEVGFPCPKTFLPENEEDLRRIANELGFPLIIKRRFTAAGRGMHLVNDLAELLDKASLSGENRGTLIQEYIPGRLNDSIAITLDKKGELKMVFCRKALCRLSRFRRIRVLDSPLSHPYAADAAKMVQRLGWWGGVTVQTVIDSRDHISKLIEINPRIGQGLWERIQVGINEPLMILKIAKDKEVEPVREYPVGTIFADPVEDAVRVGMSLMDILIYRFRIGILGKEPIDRNNPAMSLRELIQSLKQTYFSGGRRTSSLYTKYFFQDPKVSIIWWIQNMTNRWIQNRPRDLGR